MKDCPLFLVGWILTNVEIVLYFLLVALVFMKFPCFLLGFPFRGPGYLLYSLWCQNWIGFPCEFQSGFWLMRDCPLFLVGWKHLYVCFFLKAQTGINVYNLLLVIVFSLVLGRSEYLVVLGFLYSDFSFSTHQLVRVKYWSGLLCCSLLLYCGFWHSVSITEDYSW